MADKPTKLLGGPLHGHIPLVSPGSVRAVFGWPFLAPRCWLVYSETQSARDGKCALWEYDGSFPTQALAIHGRCR